MRTTDDTPGDSGDIRAAQARGTTGSRQPGTKVVDLAGVRHARRAAEMIAVMRSGCRVAIRNPTGAP